MDADPPAAPPACAAAPATGWPWLRRLHHDLTRDLFDVDGLRRLSRRPHSTLLRGLAITGYVGLTLRLAQVAVHFRSLP